MNEDGEVPLKTLLAAEKVAASFITRNLDGLTPELAQDASEWKGRRQCTDRGEAAAGVS